MFSGKKVYDITRPIQNGMTVWPGDEGISIRRTASMSNGSVVNVSRLSMGVHAGTHMDAPLHFIADGNDITEISLDKLMGEVLVVETSQRLIDESILEGLPLSDVRAVFFKTVCSNMDLLTPFYEKYPAISDGCAKALAENGIRTVGIDYLSIEPYMDKQFNVHIILLGHKVAIIENLCLKDIEPGRYSYICLPLKIANSDGSPCRVLLFR